MRKLMISAMAAGVMFSGLAVYPVKAATTSDIKVLVNARQVQFAGAAAYQTNERVMVPFRGIGESLKAKVDYANNKVTFTGNKQIALTIGSKTATVDGKPVQLDTAALAKNGRTYVPLRFISENLGQPVEWDSVGRMVWIGSRELPSIDELGLKPVSIDPYKKWFTKKSFLLEYRGKAYEKALIFKITDLPTTLLKDIYSIELYTKPSTKVTYLKIRSKTTTSAGNIYYLTRFNDIRFRNAIPSLTVNNGDGTKDSFYKIWSNADWDLDGIKDYKDFKLSDVEYIGFDAGSPDYITLMVNPWKGK